MKNSAAALGLSCLVAWVIATPLAARAQDDTSTPDSVIRFNGEDESRCLALEVARDCRAVRIEAIVVEGLGRTRRKVVTRELLFEEGGYASIDQIEESMTRLRNLGLFREVSWELVSQKVAGPDGIPAETNPARPSRVLRIRVDERWTMLPSFLLLRGGGLTRGAVGVSDINLFGRYIELGFQYDRLALDEAFLQRGGAANSFVAWVRNPRFLDTFTMVGLDAWSTVRLRSIYEDETGEREGGFTINRKMLVLRSRRELLWWLRVGLNVELVRDEFSFDYLPEETRDIQLANFGGPPPGGDTLGLRASVRYGRVNRDDFYYDGWSLTQYIGHADQIWGSDFRFSQFENILLWYKRIPWRGNLAARLRAGTTNAEQIQWLYYLGGLNRVRGYPDSRFRGQSYWSLNAEYRVAPLANRWVTIQTLGFLDAGATTDEVFDFADLDAASLGLGVRLISPKIYGLVMRADYAWPLVNGTGGALSFGAQQFF